MTTQVLSHDQARALFDILSHHEAYQELRDLRFPGMLSHSGPPFRISGEANELPLLYNLFVDFAVTLPGLRDVADGFYQDLCQEIFEDFAVADLSESYEAGYIGNRKVFATAIAAMVEAPARGYFGGFPKAELRKPDGDYDPRNPEDVVAGFHDLLQKLVYENAVAEVIERASETDKLTDHSPLVQAAHEHILVILASFLHYILIILPQGQTMLTMIKRANSLVPYIAIRQALKIGNAATMVNAVLKIVLTKMTINSVTTFLGLTKSDDSGWNLLQTIISAVVNWNTSDLKKKSAEIEKSSDGPTREQCQLIREYAEKGRDEHKKCMDMSEGRKEPIVVTIMDEYGGEKCEKLSEQQIPLALEYLCIHLSFRDRKKITNILCTRQPDLLTKAIKDCVAAYEPVIRALHEAVDLSSSVSDLENFMSDLLKFAPSGRFVPSPSIGEFVQLLKKHQGSVHKFLHQICKNGPRLRDLYKEYGQKAAANFRIKTEDTTGTENRGAGDLTQQLDLMVSELPDAQKSQVLEECDAYVAYLGDLSSSFETGMKIDVPQDSPTKSHFTRLTKSAPSTRDSSPERYRPGPGVFLRRWQAYISDTMITPTRPDGPLRRGDDPDVVKNGQMFAWGSTKNSQVNAVKNEEVRAAPSCQETVKLLGGKFRELLREVSKERGDQLNVQMTE